MGVKVTNNAYGTLSTGIDSSATTITLDGGQGSRYPSLGAGDYFYATLIDTANNLEVVKVTARSSDSMTVVRGQDNTTARAFAIGDRFELRPTAALFEAIYTEAVADAVPADGSITAAKLASTLDLSGKTVTYGLTDSDMPSGAVLQVVQTYFNTKVGLTGSAYVGLDVSITPSSSTSKILLIGSIAFGKSNVNGAVKMLRNGNTFMPNLVGSYVGGTNSSTGGWNTADDGVSGDGDWNISNQSFVYLDSPSSTSSLQYRLYYYEAENGDLYVNRQRNDNGGTSCSVLIAVEVAG